MATGLVHNSSIHSLKDELECPICLDTLMDPRTLVCQHSFCLACLRGMVGSRDRLTCPECRRDTLLPPGDRDPARLPKPILLSKLCERIRHCLEADTEGIEIYCEMCKKLDVAANVVCRECSKNMCAGCVQNHGDTALFAGHTVIPLSENTVCRQHRGEMVKFYCAQCNKGVCVVCATGSHSKHQLQDIENLGVERRKELVRWCNQFMDVADNYERQMAELSLRDEKIEEKFSRVENQVERWYDEAMALLQQNKLASLANLKHRHQNEAQKWKKYKEKVAEDHHSQRGLYDLVKSVIKSGSGAEIVACAADLGDVVPSCGGLKRPAVAVPVFTPPDVEDILSKCLVVYEIQQPGETATPSTPCIPIFPPQHRNVISADRPELRHSAHAYSDVLASSGFDMEGGRLYKTVETELGGYVRDVAWDPDTNWYYVKGPAVTKVYNPLGDEMATIEHNGWEGRGLAVDNKRGLLVTTEAAFNKIKLWTKEGDPAGDIGFSGFWHGLFRFCPEYLTYCPLADRYITTDHSKGKVAVVSPDMRSIVSRIEGTTSRLVRPRYVTCDCNHGNRACPEGLLAVSDKGDHSVKVYDEEGTLVGVLGGYGTGQGELASPSGLCYDTQGRLLVCDTRNRRVVRYTPGTPARGLPSPSPAAPTWEVLLSPEVLEQQYPKALDLTADGKLVLVTYDRNSRGNKCNHKLSIWGGYQW